ncbi:BCCT family transporter [Terracoccus luteus]|uniref:Choline/carnitine/betaine transport n=1 Tax=Terracoccus luteus TaxID=53356 RepID=A0A495Y2H3_9MICO|nr:BCCT family transporter [Terracoccus luteus]MBB2987223.1 choline/carnitine/betaine transport [Terracoccus luteus]MCP2172874.1 choline/carnitine/betaine transport [Terracoccus luteus]RKT79625.1 choline/carnitine/betaine transport [Terracoccus luteus]
MANDVRPVTDPTDGSGPEPVPGVTPPSAPPALVAPTDPTSEPLTSAEAAEQRYPTDKVVFGVAAALVVALLAWGLTSATTLSEVAGSVLKGIITGAGWGFVLVASGFVVFALWLAFSRYGRIPLGRDDEGPEFRTVSWVAMMFSAGMGIGLMFYGVGEPLAHFTSPPPNTVSAGTPQAIDVALATTLFHWTLHPWAIYAVVGLAIAYGAFRRGRRQLISATLTPLLGRERVEGGFGRAIDILAIFATLFGSAASLGLGALQIGGGLIAGGYMTSVGTPLLVIIIAVLTAAFVASAVSGVSKGIQWLSNTNMVLAVVLALVVFVGGPTIMILNLLPTMIGDYFSDLTEMASRTAASGGDATATWLSGWTIFYWAWWISWTPFVGMFIARISRGRTIREFVAGVILIPSTVTLVWFAIFGGAAISAQDNGTNLAERPIEGQLFGLLDTLPLGAVLGIIAMTLVAIFFVSGADAASIVMGTLSQRGTIHPSKRVVIFWGVMMGAIAALMLVVGGSDALSGIQNITIIMAAPFAVVMVAMCLALFKELRQDPLVRRGVRCETAIEQAVDFGTKEYGDEFRLSVKPHKDAGDVTSVTAPSGSDQRT